MTVALRWIPSLSASVLHAAEGLCRGWKPTDEELAAALDGPARSLAGEIAAAGLPPSPFWRHLTALAATMDHDRQLVRVALHKTIGPGESADELARRLSPLIGELKAAALRCRADLVEQLALRGGPLREQWEARGPGMLAGVAAMTEEGVLPKAVDVVLLHPSFGGGGRAHLLYGSVGIEALLANPHAALPEAVRLAWLISQSHLGAPRYGEKIHGERLSHVAALAMLPPVLQAAERVELAVWSAMTVRLAVAAWRIAVPPDVDAGDMLSQWWETYAESGGAVSFATALTALDRMIG